jgi:hypothetical protein
MKVSLAKTLIWIVFCMFFVGGTSTNMRASGGPAPLPGPGGSVASLHLPWPR